MAISTTFKDVQEEFNPQYWKSIDEFEEFYLWRLSEKLADTNYYTDRNGVEVKIQPVNHYPELQEYEVWMPGYQATGDSANAHLVGKVKARNFAQACHILMCKQKLENIEKENALYNRDYVTSGRWDYDPSTLSYGACPLYRSEELARKSFG